MNDIVQVIDATKIYPGNITAVDNVSLSVKEGEFVTLLGPSGCGKTTTLRMIAGFEYPTSGKILLANNDVTALPPYERAVNTVFQDYALFPHMTIRENVGYGLKVAGFSKSMIESEVKESLTTVGLLEKADARPSSLSGGQKQRVALARALVRKPKVLLLDEPLSALDAKLRESMQVELKHLHEQSGITFVFVTHDQREALVMSDRVVVMQDGRIKQSGTPSELYDQPASPYVAEFIGSSNKLYGSIAQSRSSGVVLQIGDNKILASNVRGDISLHDNIVATVRPEKIHLLSEQERQRNTEFSTIMGTVREVLFHGSSCRLRIDIDGQHSFDVDLQLKQGLEATEASKIGSKVTLGIAPQSVSVFPISEDTT